MKNKKKKPPKGYDSRLEYDLHTKELKDWEYHPKEKIEYVVPSTYEPDFYCETSSGCILVEVKGHFRTRDEASKYVHIRNSLEEQGYPSKQKEKAEIVFIFQDSNKPMPFVKRRKDGTKQTHGEWASKNGFRYQCCKCLDMSSIGIPDGIRKD